MGANVRRLSKVGGSRAGYDFASPACLIFMTLSDAINLRSK
jgi:hypothetical protein